MRRHHHRRTLLPLAAAVGILAPGLALACGNAVRIEKEAAVKLIAELERKLDAGRSREVRAAIEADDVYFEDPGLNRRFTIVGATAYIRTGAPLRGIEWLRRSAEATPNDALISSRLAEGLAKTKRGRPQALAILSRLEAKDLIPDAEGFLALAQLRAEAADAEGRDRALERCRAMAREPGVCKVAVDAAPKEAPKAKTKAEKREPLES